MSSRVAAPRAVASATVPVATLWTRAVLVALVLVPMALNAVMLFPELSVPVPHVNDDAHHYLFVERANEALFSGESVVDHWLPEVEIGFPIFFYYQHLPHLTVVAVHRLLAKQVSLLTLYNVIRYVLLLAFPLTVYWSLRRLGFSPVAGATAAMASSLMHSSRGWGLEYGSYVWRGYGMYTQLWAVHLFFIALACLGVLIERGKGYLTTILALAALGLTHLFYSYAMAPVALVLLVLGMDRANARARILRLAIVSGLAALVTAYLWLPFVMQSAYLTGDRYLPRWRSDSFGARDVLTWLVNGDLLDHGRLPCLTLLLAVGVGAAITSRTRLARLALALFALMLALFFGRPTWGALLNVLPFHEGLPLHRFIGGVHIAALLLIGLGGEWLWSRLAGLRAPWHAAIAGSVLLAVVVPALRDRHAFYAGNTAMIANTHRALDADADAHAIIETLKGLPPGRTYAGLRANWGKDLRIGNISFFNLLAFHRIVAVAPPYGSFTLNADLMWHFDDRNPAYYDIFDVRYVVAPAGLAVPQFLQPITRTPRYALYRVDTTGYARFASVGGPRAIATRAVLHTENLAWLQGGAMETGRFVRYEFPARVATTAPTELAACPPGEGRIDEERVRPGRIDLRVSCPRATGMVFKFTYHPNWRVAVDGQPVRTFMVSPSYVGFEMPAGAHRVEAEYRSPVYKTALLVLGGLALIAMIALRRHFARLP